MANELQADTNAETGLTAYFVLKDAVGQVWDGTALAAYSTANRNGGAVAATGRADGSYVATAPALAAGVYSYDLFAQAGASPAESDRLVSSGGVLEWNGSAVLPLSGLPAAWGASVIGNGRTRDFFLQGGSNRIEFAADGLSFTIYSTDDTTVLDTGTATRLDATVGGLQGINPA